MRVLYLSHYADLYGANRSLLDLLDGSRSRHGAEPYVLLACGGPMEKALAQRGIEHRVVPFGTWMHVRHYSGGTHHRVMQWWRQYRAQRLRMAAQAADVRRLGALVSDMGVDLVHSNSSVIGAGAGLAALLGVPHVWHVREIHDKHYGYLVDGGERRYAQALRQAGAVIAVSQAVADHVRQLAGPSVRCEVIHNGVWPVAGSEVHRSVRSVEGPFRILCVGLIHPSKGQWVLLEAFDALHRRHPQARLTFMGGGRTERLLQAVQRLGLSEVVSLVGFHENPAVELSRAHVLVSASVHEAFGRAVAEAMAHGLPVVVHDSGAMRELVEHGVTGRTCGGAPVSYTQALEDLLLDPDLCQRMGAAGRERVRHLFRTDVMVDRVAALHRALLDGRPD